MTTVQFEKIPQRRVDNFRKLLEMGYSTHFDNCFHWTSNGINIESWEMVLTLDDMGLDDLAYYFVCKSHIEEAIEQERISQLSLEVKTLTSGIPNNGISFLSEEYLMPVLRKMLADTGDEFYQDVVNTTKTTNLRYEQIAEMLTSLSGAEEKTKNTYDIEVILSWGNPEAMTRMTRITFPLIQNLPLLKSLLS